MGSDNSKSKNTRNESAEALNYGPAKAPPKPPIRQHQNPVPPRVVQAAPRTDPFAVNYKPAVYQARPQTVFHTSPQPIISIVQSGTHQPKPQMVVTTPARQTLAYSQMPPTAESNPSKWNNNQSQQQNAAQATTYKAKVDIQKSEYYQQQKPLTGRQSGYDANDNPCMWSSQKQNAAHKTINLDEVLPNVKKAIAAHTNADFIKLNKLLNKNQPVAESRKALVNNPYLADIKFYLNGKEFYGHKAFLTTSSGLFHKHFSTSNEMAIESINEDAFLMLLTYCYTNQLKLTPDNVLSLLEAANVLDIRQATNVCHGFISNMINSESVFSIFEKAIEHDSEMFQKKCLDYIVANEAKCFNSMGFYNIKIPSLTTILEKCQYEQSKSSELIEKWYHGALHPALQASSAPSAPAVQTGGAKKKPPAQKNPKQAANKKPQQPKIPSLVDLVIPAPPFAEGAYGKILTMSLVDDLINFDDDDDDKMSVITYDDDNDDNSSEIICVDDDDAMSQITVAIRGSQKTMETLFSRIDFTAKRSFLLHSIWFNENLFVNTKEVKLSISVFDQNKRSDIHNRVIKNNKPGMKLNYVKFSKKPLKIYARQRWIIKLNFTQSGPRIHLSPDGLSTSNILEIGASDKKYFNCISRLVVTEMKKNT